MLAKFGTNSGGITWWSKFELIQVLKLIQIQYSWKDNSSYKLYTLGPLCLWQCFKAPLHISGVLRWFWALFTRLWEFWFSTWWAPSKISSCQSHPAGVFPISCIKEHYKSLPQATYKRRHQCAAGSGGPGDTAGSYFHDFAFAFVSQLYFMTNIKVTNFRKKIQQGNLPGSGGPGDQLIQVQFSSLGPRRTSPDWTI